MNSQRKEAMKYALLVLIISLINYCVGKEVLTFIAKYILYWGIFLVCAIAFIHSIWIILFSKDSSIEVENAKKCPYYVEPKNGEE